MAKYEPNTAHLEKLAFFMERTSVTRLSRNLRNLIMEHLAVSTGEHTFNKEDLLFDIINLFELLDALDAKGK